MSRNTLKRGDIKKIFLATSELSKVQFQPSLHSDGIIFIGSTGFGILSPLCAVILPHLFITPQPIGLILASLMCSGFSSANYLWFLKKKNLNFARALLAGIFTGCFSLAVFASGGLHSCILIFGPTILLVSGLLNGIRGVVWLTLTLMVFFTVLALCESIGIIAPVATTLTPQFLWIEASSSIAFSGGLTYLFVLLRERIENQLKTLNASLLQEKVELTGAREQVEMQRKELEDLFNHAPCGYHSLDQDGNFVRMNATELGWIGYSSEEVIGKMKILSLISEDTRHLFTKCLLENKKSETFQNVELKLVRKDGTSFPVLLSATIEFDPDGHFITNRSILVDLTVQKDLENKAKINELQLIQASKLASLGEMSAGVAHEINNPLAIISGNLELLSKSIDHPDKFGVRIATIQKATLRISKIVSGLKKLSRSGLQHNFENYSLCNVLKEAILLTEIKAKRHNTPVSCDLRSESLICCDQIEIEQVLINLINNGIDAIEDLQEKWVKLELFDDAQFVVLRVIDSGPGIPEKVVQKLFDPFFTTKKVGEGTGLGLSIAKGILEQHKATIAVIPYAQNTCFEMRFQNVKNL